MGKSAKTTSKNSLPAWASTPIQGLVGGITEAGKVDPLSRIAGSNPLIDTAKSTLLAGLDPSIKSMIEGAGGAASVSATKAADYYKDYANPFEKDVINTSLNDYDVGAGRQTAEADLGLAGSGAFSGSGASLAKSLLGGEIARGRGSLSAGLRSQGFNTAMGLGSQDANRFLDASKANASFADAAAGRKLQGAGLLGNLQSQMTGQQFSMGDYLRNMENERLNADYGNLSKQVGLIGGLDLGNLFGTKTETKTPGTLDYIKSGAGIASMFFSDARLKTDIVRVGTRPDGLGVYLYRYIWGPMLFLGVMAQEVLQIRPDAVAVHPSGFLMVDYGVL